MDRPNFWAPRGSWSSVKSVSEARPDVHQKSLLPCARTFSRNPPTYYYQDLSDNGWNKKDDNCRKKPRTFHMNLINLNKKALITRISEKSFVKNVEIHAHTHCQGSIVCYGTEEELLKAGWEIDKIIVEYRTRSTLCRSDLSRRLRGNLYRSLPKEYRVSSHRVRREKPETNRSRYWLRIQLHCRYGVNFWTPTASTRINIGIGESERRRQR